MARGARAAEEALLREVDGLSEEARVDPSDSHETISTSETQSSTIAVASARAK